MLEFIIINDNVPFQKRMKQCIQNVMKKQNMICQIKVYDDYIEEAYQVISKTKSGIKVYLLDMETPSMKLQDYVRKIRKYDFASPIIGFGDERFLFIALKCQFVDYINYFYPQWEHKLKESLSFWITRVAKKEHLRFTENDIQYELHTQEIAFLQRYKKKKTIIQTESCSYLVSYTLEELKPKLPSYFVYESRTRISNLHKTKLLNATIVNDKQTKKKEQPQKGKRYSPSIHQEAIYMYYNGATEEQILQKFGMHLNTLRIWIAKDKTEKYMQGKENQRILQQEIATLHSRNIKLTTENEVLKKEKRKADANCERFRKAVHILSESTEES